MRQILPTTFLLASLVVSAQLNTPEPSTHSELIQHIGFTEVELVYSRPNLDGRNLFGEMLPWGTVWRTGANANTKISFSKDVFVQGNRVSKGIYGLYSIPNENEWTIILNSDTSLWGAYGYDEKFDVLRFSVKPKSVKENVETLHIFIRDITDKSGVLDLRWGTLSVPINVEIDWEAQDQQILADIDSVLALPLDRDSDMRVAHDYLHASMYYLKYNKDLEQALKWVNKAIDIEVVSYFPLYKAEILAKLKRYDEAIEASNQGLDIFMVTGNNKEWIWRYKQQIELWNKLKKG
ncbi:MAG: DUF2911 domain-containing protein [Cyclobacteriaceae bacterium]